MARASPGAAGASLSGQAVSRLSAFAFALTHSPSRATDTCGELDLLPAQLDSGFRMKNASSWGGQVVESSPGEYALYLAVFANNCGLASWKSNSYVGHATAQSPLGPYTLQPGRVHGIFSHNPTVFSSPGGAESSTSAGEAAAAVPSLVMAQIGCGGGQPPGGVRTCRNGSTPCVVPHSRQHRMATASSAMVATADLAAASCDGPHWTGASDYDRAAGNWTAPRV